MIKPTPAPKKISDTFPKRDVLSGYVILIKLAMSLGPSPALKYKGIASELRYTNWFIFVTLIK